MSEHKTTNARMGMQNGGRTNRSGVCQMRGMNRMGMTSSENVCKGACGEGGGCTRGGCEHSMGYPMEKHAEHYMEHQAERRMEHHADCGLCKEAMERLKMLEFAIVDVAHYLNAYPDSECALAYYHKLVEERDLLRTKMNEECGPLTIYDNVSHDSWDWVKGPWPWKPEAN